MRRNERVASLAALGTSHRVITVEQHLTRVYRKLNVTSRADLPSEFQTLTVGSD